MTQELKELLKRDLCSRLDTNLVCSIYRVDDYGVGYRDEILSGYCKGDNWYEFYFGDDCGIGIDDVSKIKPYLIPMSSITEEQSMELFKLFGISLVDSIGTDYIKINECTGITFFLDNGFDIETHLVKLIDWLNKNHFDYRGLIPMDLAIDATGLNVY